MKLVRISTNARSGHRRRTPGARRIRAFTLIELLVVIVIIAVLASIAVPSLKGLGQSNVLAAANRQIMDDIISARLRAINERTTVYLVFVPPASPELSAHMNKLAAAQRKILTNLYGGQFTTYALLAERSVGDQPGRLAEPRYLTEWKSLPDGMLFPDFKYRSTLNVTNHYLRAFPERKFNFPTSRSPEFALPYIAFNGQGQLIEYDLLNRKVSPRDQVIPLARGSILVPRDKHGDVQTQVPANIVITPKENYTNNFIRINWLTGRASVERPQLR